MHPAVVERALAYAEAAILLDRTADQRTALEADLAANEAAVRRLTAAIAAGGELAPLVDALKTYRRDLETRLAIVRAPRPTFDPDAVRRQLDGYLVDWRGLFRANVEQGQQILRRLAYRALAVRVAESVLDRTGHKRPEKLELESRQTLDASILSTGLLRQIAEELREHEARNRAPLTPGATPRERPED